MSVETSEVLRAYLGYIKYSILVSFVGVGVTVIV